MADIRCPHCHKQLMEVDNVFVALIAQSLTFDQLHDLISQLITANMLKRATEQRKG